MLSQNPAALSKSRFKLSWQPSTQAWHIPKPAIHCCCCTRAAAHSSHDTSTPAPYMLLMLPPVPVPPGKPPLTPPLLPPAPTAAVLLLAELAAGPAAAAAAEPWEAHATPRARTGLYLQQQAGQGEQPDARQAVSGGVLRPRHALQLSVHDESAKHGNVQRTDDNHCIRERQPVACPHPPCTACPAACMLL